MEDTSALDASEALCALDSALLARGSKKYMYQPQAGSSATSSAAASPTKHKATAAASAVAVNESIPKSQYRGVSWDRRMKTWRTKINSVHLGYFDDEVEAARAYDESAIALRGSGTKELNFDAQEYEQQSNTKESNWMEYNSRHGLQPRGTSQYRGVMWDKAAASWRAKIKSRCRTVYLGVFVDEKKAATAYDKAASILHGDNARRNFPDSPVVPLDDPKMRIDAARLARQKTLTPADKLREAEIMREIKSSLRLQYGPGRKRGRKPKTKEIPDTGSKVGTKSKKKKSPQRIAANGSSAGSSVVGSGSLKKSQFDWVESSALNRKVSSAMDPDIATSSGPAQIKAVSVSGASETMAVLLNTCEEETAESLRLHGRSKNAMKHALGKVQTLKRIRESRNASNAKRARLTTGQQQKQKQQEQPTPPQQQQQQQQYVHQPQIQYIRVPVHIPVPMYAGAHWPNYHHPSATNNNTNPYMLPNNYAVVNSGAQWFSHRGPLPTDNNINMGNVTASMNMHSMSGLAQHTIPSSMMTCVPGMTSSSSATRPFMSTSAGLMNMPTAPMGLMTYQPRNAAILNRPLVGLHHQLLRPMHSPAIQYPNLIQSGHAVVNNKVDVGAGAEAANEEPLLNLIMMTTGVTASTTTTTITSKSL